MRAPIVLAAALASGASLISAAPASAAPPPVQGVQISSSADSQGNVYAAISWSPPSEADGARACAQQGIHPATDPNACDYHVDTDTTSSTLILGSGKTYTFSVFAYTGAGSTREYAQPVTTQPWHGSKVRLRLACAPAPTYGEPCPFEAVLKDTHLDSRLQGAAVELWRGTVQSNPDWHLVDSDRTNGSGVAQVPVTLRKKDYFQWRFQGIQGVLASTTYRQLIKPAIKVTAHLTSSRATSGGKVKLYGIVRPAIADLRITLAEYQTSPCRGWLIPGQHTRAARQRLPNGNTTFGYVMTISRTTPGTHEFRVLTGGHDGLQPGGSNTVTLDVGSSALRGSTRNAPRAPAC